MKPVSTFTRSLTGEGRRERMSSLAAATSSTVTPQSCAILGSLFAPSSAKYLRTIVSASGASASSRLSCSSRHSLRSPGRDPGGLQALDHMEQLEIFALADVQKGAHLVRGLAEIAALVDVLYYPVQALYLPARKQAVPYLHAQEGLQAHVDAPGGLSMSAPSEAEPESFRRRLNSSLASSYEMMTLFSLVPL